jgi:hypothetical protein
MGEVEEKPVASQSETNVNNGSVSSAEVKKSHLSVKSQKSHHGSVAAVPSFYDELDHKMYATKESPAFSGPKKQSRADVSPLRNIAAERERTWSDKLVDILCFVCDYSEGAYGSKIPHSPSP